MRTERSALLFAFPSRCVPVPFAIGLCRLYCCGGGGASPRLMINTSKNNVDFCFSLFFVVVAGS